MERERIREEERRCRIEESYKQCVVNGSIQHHSCEVYPFFRVNLELLPLTQWNQASVMKEVRSLMWDLGVRVKGDEEKSLPYLNLIVASSRVQSIHIQACEIQVPPTAGWWSDEEWLKWYDEQAGEVTKECVCNLNLLILVCWGCGEEKLKRAIAKVNKSIEVLFVKNTTSKEEITGCVERLMLDGLHTGQSEEYSPVTVGEIIWQSSLVLCGGSFISKAIACESVKIVFNHLEMMLSKEDDVLNRIESISDTSFMESFYSFCTSDPSLGMFSLVLIFTHRSVSVSESFLQSLYSDLVPKRRKQQFHLRKMDPTDFIQPEPLGWITQVDTLRKRARSELSDALNYSEFLKKACQQVDVNNLLECSGVDILSLM